MSVGDSKITAPRRRLLLALAGVSLALIIAAAVYFIFFHSRSPQATASALPDPRLQYAGAFRNIHPSVQYVPEPRCAGCHEKEARAFADHPMGRSLLPIAQASAPAGSSPDHNHFTAFESQFEVDTSGDRVRHRRIKLGPDGKPAIEQTWDVHFVIGSGSRGHSYLTDTDGFLVQTPISWYSQKKDWGVSPSFEAEQLTGRPIVPGCLACHANRANHRPGTVNRYEAEPFAGHAIGCQRCHGPGELHLVKQAKGPDGFDSTIVNPRRLAPHEREAVCEQCHLQGQTRILHRGRDWYDFRPGLPVEAFWSVFVAAADSQKAVGQVEQMYQSRCFQKSAGPGRLGCISCHDPHARVPKEQRIRFYRGKCLTCHEQRGCSLPRERRAAKQDSCIDCHMPPLPAPDIPHTASIDHRILRFGKPAAPAKSKPMGDELPVVPFHRSAWPDEDERNLALAVVELAAGRVEGASEALGRLTPRLDAALRRDRGDLEALEGRAYALALQNRWADALTDFDAVLARTPQRESALEGAASMAESLGRRDDAIARWRQAVALNPHSPAYRHSLAVLLTKNESWDEALRHCDDWIRLDSFSADAHTTRLVCLLALGKKNDARAEFAKLEALAPPNLPELRARFGPKLP